MNPPSLVVKEEYQAPGGFTLIVNFMMHAATIGTTDLGSHEGSEGRIAERIRENSFSKIFRWDFHFRWDLFSLSSRALAFVLS